MAVCMIPRITNKLLDVISNYIQEAKLNYLRHGENCGNYLLPDQYVHNMIG